MLGQGSSFFYVSNQGSDEDVEVVAVQSFHNGQSEQNVAAFIEKAGVTPDLILNGSSIDHYAPTIDFKQFCGQYYSASGFGAILGYAILKTGVVPNGSSVDSPKSVLVNAGFGKDQGLILLRIG